MVCKQSAELMLKVGVHKAFPNVDAAETFRVASMVSCVAVPDVVTHDGALTSAVLHDAPYAIGLITIEVVEEVALEDSIILE